MQVKGSALLHIRTFLATRWGSEATAAVLAMLPEEIRVAFSSPTLSPHGWHSIAIWNALADALARWPGKQGVIREIAAYAAEQDLNLTHRVLLKLASPGLVMRQAGVLWGNYFNGGRLTPFAEEERRFRLVLHLGIDPHTDPGRLTCRDAVPAWHESALRLAGAHGGKSVHVKCRFDRHPTCEFEVTWR